MKLSISTAGGPFEARLRPNLSPLKFGNRIKPKIQKANRHSRNRQNSRRDVGIDQFIQIMEQKTASVRHDSGFNFAPVLQQSQRARPRQQFRENPPKERRDVQPAKHRTSSCEQSSEDYP